MSGAFEDLQVSLGLVREYSRNGGVAGDEKILEAMQRRQKPDHSCFPSADFPKLMDPTSSVSPLLTPSPHQQHPWTKPLPQPPTLSPSFQSCSPREFHVHFSEGTSDSIPTLSTMAIKICQQVLITNKMGCKILTYGPSDVIWPLVLSPLAHLPTPQDITATLASLPPFPKIIPMSVFCAQNALTWVVQISARMSPALRSLP